MVGFRYNTPTLGRDNPFRLLLLYYSEVSMYSFCLAIFACCFSLIQCTISFSQELSADREHAAGVIESYLANLESWEKGDVLVRMTSNGSGRYFRVEDQGGFNVPPKFVEGPDSSSLTVQEDLLFRLVFDFEKQKTLIIHRNRSERQVFDGLDKESIPRKVAGDAQVLLNDPSRGMLSRVTNGRVQSFEAINTVSKVLQMQAPDIRILGIEPISRSWDTEYLQDRLNGLAVVDKISEITNVAKQSYQLTYLGEGEEKGLIRRFDWDLERNLPVKFWRGTLECGTWCEGAVRWQSINNQYVPVSARYMNTSGDSQDSRFYLVETETTVDLHWFSFGQDLPDDLFEDSVLDDHKKLNEMLDEDVFKDMGGDRGEESRK
ncbi:MAG: hypothetical protein Q8M16_23590 [Pirellulaceae bacterium]|nr:hypothetical protein [Pirellulaceae bacterium]